jgi:hypothetical protein
VDQAFLEDTLKRFHLSATPIVLRKDLSVYVREDKTRLFFGQQNPINEKIKTQELLKSLPKETHDINFFFEKFIDQDGLVDLQGWAYINDFDSGCNLIYIVLQADKIRYVYPVISQKRPDVSANFKIHDYDDSGFVLKINKSFLSKGRYRIGIYIKNGPREALVFTDHFILV